MTLKFLISWPKSIFFLSPFLGQIPPADIRWSDLQFLTPASYLISIPVPGSNPQKGSIIHLLKDKKGVPSLDIYMYYFIRLFVVDLCKCS